MDWASRTWLSWRLSNTLAASFCVEAVHEALERDGPPEIFNSDQGSPCTSVCAGKARSRGTRCRDVIFETLFETLWVSNPIRPRSATSRNRVMRGPGVT